MANPQNPLDKFVTYTTHFELHAAKSWDSLKTVPANGTNLATTERDGVGTLLINTRKDAHQHIDNVRFRYCSPTVDPSAALQAIDEVVFDVIEPNGTFFIEKIQNQAAKYQVKDFTGGMIFGLKIIFVGRLENGAEATESMPQIIPMQCIDISSRYSFKGGEHHFRLVTSGTTLATSPLRSWNGLARAVSYTNKNISFKAKTVQEAIPLLAEQLNKNYKDVYDTELKNCQGARPIRYRISLDSEIVGDLSLVTKSDSYSRDEKSHLTFTPNVDIGTMIRMILTSSKEVCEMIAKSDGKLNVPLHDGVKLPVLQTLYYLKEDELEVHFNVVLYNGRGPEYEFFYYFSGPGKNVDILEFETKFPAMSTWLSTTISGAELNRNANSTVPSEHPDHHANNNVHKDTTRNSLFISPQDKKCIPAGPGDIAYLPAVNRSEGTGYLKLDADAVPAAKLAFQVIGQACSALDSQVSFTIRGHKNILENLITYPDGESTGFGVNSGMWIKVHIYNADGSPFFYTGYYKMLTVDNIFSNGKFTQILTAMMLTGTEQGITA